LTYFSASKEKYRELRRNSNRMVVETKGKDLFGRVDNAVEESAKAMNEMRESVVWNETIHQKGHVCVFRGFICYIQMMDKI